MASSGIGAYGSSAPSSPASTPAKKSSTTTPKKSSTKRGGKAAGLGESPPKKTKPVELKTAENLKPEDQLLLKLKQEGHNWDYIGDMLEPIIGKRLLPGALAKRHQRLRDSLQQWSLSDDIILVNIFHQQDSTFDERVKEKMLTLSSTMRNEMWTTISAHVAEYGSTKYNVGACEKRIQQLRQSGRLDELIDTQKHTTDGEMSPKPDAEHWSDATQFMGPM